MAAGVKAAELRELADEDLVARLREAKAELFKIPLFGQILKGINVFPVKRGLADKAAIYNDSWTNPKYYERMSQLLDALIKERKQEALEYQKYLEKIVALTKQVMDPSDDQWDVVGLTQHDPTLDAGPGQGNGGPQIDRAQAAPPSFFRIRQDRCGHIEGQPDRQRGQSPQLASRQDLALVGQDRKEGRRPSRENGDRREGEERIDRARKPSAPNQVGDKPHEHEGPQRNQCQRSNRCLTSRSLGEEWEGGDRDTDQEDNPQRPYDLVVEAPARGSHAGNSTLRETRCRLPPSAQSRAEPHPGGSLADGPGPLEWETAGEGKPCVSASSKR